jgi:5-methyltetrahydrofolate--homocysteine methyltransferase
LARDSGAKIIGGCCGTTPDHLVKMREALETRAPNPRPSLEQIVDALGALSSAADGTGDTPAPTRTRRRRRS